MEYALDKNNNLIKASYANYGDFKCPECKNSVGLRKTYKTMPFPHFYHTGRIKDPGCRKCYYEDNWEKKENL
jgi:competence CoiA-like predicted nuclease